jgi:hypothetical protein
MPAECRCDGAKIAALEAQYWLELRSAAAVYEAQDNKITMGAMSAAANIYMAITRGRTAAEYAQEVAARTR